MCQIVRSSESSSLTLDKARDVSNLLILKRPSSGSLVKMGNNSATLAKSNDFTRDWQNFVIAKSRLARRVCRIDVWLGGMAGQGFARAHGRHSSPRQPSQPFNGRVNVVPLHWCPTSSTGAQPQRNDSVGEPQCHRAPSPHVYNSFQGTGRLRGKWWARRHVKPAQPCGPQAVMVSFGAWRKTAADNLLS